ncbi:MAG: ATP-dependent Clp protease adaptor ClpS [Caldilineae bacterium]|nr:ATP-dependent Clp protease adaptor ClpS [Caldilineae bacterium]
MKRLPDPPRLDAGQPGPGDGQADGQVLTRTERKVERPRRWQVLLHNDDYTTMEFVVEVLVRHFRKSPAEATQVMLQVHHKGVGVAGVYPRDEAETKVALVTAEARELGMPLVVSAEPEG